MHFIMGLKKRSIVVPPLLHSSSTEPLHPFLPQLLEMLRSVNLGKAHSVQGKGHCTERGIVQKQAGPFPPPKKTNSFSLPRLKLKAEASRYQLSAPRPPSRAPPARRTLDPGAEVGERRAQPLRPPRASAPRGGHGSGRRPLRPLPGTFSSCRARRRPRGAGRRRRPPRRRRRAAAPRGPSPPLGPRRESFARPPAPCRSGARPAGPPRPPASPGGRVWLLRAELGERGPRRAGRLLPGERPAAGGVAPARPRPRGCRRHREAAGTGRPRRDPGGGSGPPEARPRVSVAGAQRPPGPLGSQCWAGAGSGAGRCLTSACFGVETTDLCVKEQNNPPRRLVKPSPRQDNQSDSDAVLCEQPGLIPSVAWPVLPVLPVPRCQHLVERDQRTGPKFEATERSPA